MKRRALLALPLALAGCLPQPVPAVVAIDVQARGIAVGWMTPDEALAEFDFRIDTHIGEARALGIWLQQGLA